MKPLLHISFSSGLVLATVTAGLCQQGYREVEWPIPATSAAGTPAPWHFGEVAAAATTSDGKILVLHRGAQPVMEFDIAGKFLRSWGEGTISEGKVTGILPEARAPDGSGYTVVYGPAGCHACGAHSIRVDADGNIWLVDAAAHAVYKMDSQGSVLMQLGEKGVAGTDHGHFNLPTDVAVAPDGAVYVSDGYGSARVVKFSSDGKYLLEWGKRGTGPGEFGCHTTSSSTTGAACTSRIGTTKGSKSSTPKASSLISGGRGRRLHAVHDRGPADLGRGGPTQP